MDPLSDVIALLKPQSFITVGFDAGGDWAMRHDGQGNSIKCYSVISGGCLLAVEEQEPVSLQAGDCFVLPSGRPFVLASDLAVEPLHAPTVFGSARKGGVVTIGGGGGLYLVGSRFVMNGHHADLLLRTLPPVMHIEAADDQAALRWSMERMMGELRDERPGARLMAEHLSHMMLLGAMRTWLATGVRNEAGWFFALSDPRMATAIGAMHREPARDWTLAELAVAAGMSRSIFAQRFREKVGEAPIAYLTRWRMMLAADRLVSGRDPLAKTARDLGYGSENAFNTAFKRVMGCSPRRYARTEGERQDLPLTPEYA